MNNDWLYPWFHFIVAPIVTLALVIAMIALLAPR